jgi:hypothetical protein
VILLGGVEVFIVFNFLHWLCHVAAVAWPIHGLDNAVSDRLGWMCC